MLARHISGNSNFLARREAVGLIRARNENGAKLGDERIPLSKGAVLKSRETAPRTHFKELQGNRTS